MNETRTETASAASSAAASLLDRLKPAEVFPPLGCAAELGLPGAGLSSACGAGALVGYAGQVGFPFRVGEVASREGAGAADPGSRPAVPLNDESAFVYCGQHRAVVGVGGEGPGG